MGPPTAAELRWQGDIDRQLKEATRRFERGDKRFEDQDKEIDQLSNEVTALKVKVMFAAAIGSIVGGGIVTFIFAIASKAIGS